MPLKHGPTRTCSSSGELGVRSFYPKLKMLSVKKQTLIGIKYYLYNPMDKVLNLVEIGALHRECGDNTRTTLLRAGLDRLFRFCRGYNELDPLSAMNTQPSSHRFSRPRARRKYSPESD